MPNKPKPASSANIKVETKRTILGILTLALAGLASLSFFSVAGIIGQLVDKGLSFLFGYGKFLIPIWLLYMASNLLYQAKTSWLDSVRLTSLGLGLAASLGLWNLFQFGDQLSLDIAENGIGGGYVGLLAVWVTTYLFGYWGSVLVLVTIVVVAVLIILNQGLPLADAFSWLKELLNQSDDLAQSENSKSILTPTEAKSIPAGRLFRQEGDESVEVNSKDDKDEKTKKIVGAKTPDWMKASQFSLPTIDLLEKGKKDDTPQSGDIKTSSEIIKNTLATFGIEVEMGKIDVGPSVTRFMLRPSNGIKLSRITALQNDLALALAAQAIRIEAPIPGMSYVGVETPNLKRATVRIRQILESKEFSESDYQLPLALGRDVMNKVIVFPLEKMPHLLIAGATGAGKSMGLNAMILSMLYKNPPSRLKLIFVDPKRVELSTYNGIPHLLAPAIVNPDKAMNALNWCVTEMERRYEVLARVGSRNIFSYNEKIAAGELGSADPDSEYEIMPFIVVIIDELADLMSSHKKEVEGSIVRIAQMARAVGIHLILATQRPSTDVITGLIKANLPSRISFQVASQIDSRTVLDMMGAEKLLGMGDMLFLGGDLGKPQRIQGPFVPEHEVKEVVEWLKKQGEHSYDLSITETDTPKQFFRNGSTDDFREETDELFEQAKDLVLQTGKGSASLLQRRLKVGYARAARLLDELEMAGVVGPAEGSKPREVIIEGYVEDVE